MPTEVVDVLDPDAPDPQLVKVKEICEGCGETIRTYEAFEDTVDENVRPVHDSASCLRAAQSGGES